MLIAHHASAPAASPGAGHSTNPASSSPRTVSRTRTAGSPTARILACERLAACRPAGSSHPRKGTRTLPARLGSRAVLGMPPGLHRPHAPDPHLLEHLAANSPPVATGHGQQP